MHDRWDRRSWHYDGRDAEHELLGRRSAKQWRDVMWAWITGIIHVLVLIRFTRGR